MGDYGDPRVKCGGRYSLKTAQFFAAAVTYLHFSQRFLKYRKFFFGPPKNRKSYFYQAVTRGLGAPGNVKWFGKSFRSENARCLHTFIRIAAE